MSYLCLPVTVQQTTKEMFSLNVVLLLRFGLDPSTERHGHFCVQLPRVPQTSGAATIFYFGGVI